MRRDLEKETVIDGSYEPASRWSATFGGRSCVGPVPGWRGRRRLGAGGGPVQPPVRHSP